MAVALDVRDAERPHGGEVLLERDDGERGQVLRGHEEKVPPLAAAIPPVHKRPVEERLEDTLAVLGAHATIAELDRRLERVELAVALVDDEGQADLGEPFGDAPIERHRAVERLLDERDRLAEARQPGSPSHALEQGGEVPERFVLLVAVEGDDVGLGDQAIERGGYRREAGQVLVELAADFHLEVSEAVRPDALLERLWKPVTQPAVRGNVGGRDGIEQTHGMAHGQGLGRRALRPAHEVVLLELAVHRSRADLQEIVAQERYRISAGQPCGGVRQRPLEEGRAEGDGEGVEVQRRARAPALREGVEPDLEDGARDLGRVEVRLMGDPDRAELVLDVVLEALGGVFVEPLRGQVVTRVPARAPAVGRLDLHRDVEQGEARERDDAVPEREPRLEVPDMKRSGLEREPYRNAGMTSLAISSSSRMMCRCGMPGKKSRQIRWVRPYSLTKGSRARRT